jgi:ParB-like chromosome segregation protein Spo0J
MARRGGEKQGEGGNGKADGGQPVQIEQVATADLIPYARNARTHSESQVAQIAGSIQEFGFTNPVLIDSDNGIIAGHGRVIAAQKLGLQSVPCIRLGYLTDAQKRAYILADNRIALNSGWDDAMLEVELAELHADEYDLGLLGFDADELAKFMGYNAAVVDPPELAEGDREPFRQMTFTVHDSQFEAIEAALKKAKEAGGGKSDVNENSNGNALAAICEAFNG